MTVKEFVKRVQDYYGMYPAGQKQAIAEYLETKKPKYLDFLYGELIKTFSSKWKATPDIAIFEECRKGFLDDYKAEIVYERTMDLIEGGNHKRIEQKT